MVPTDNDFRTLRFKNHPYVFASDINILPTDEPVSVFLNEWQDLDVVM